MRAGFNISVKLNNVVVKYVETEAYAASLTLSSLHLCNSADGWQDQLEVRLLGRQAARAGDGWRWCRGLPLPPDTELEYTVELGQSGMEFPALQSNQRVLLVEAHRGCSTCTAGTVALGL